MRRALNLSRPRRSAPLSPAAARADRPRGSRTESSWTAPRNGSPSWTPQATGRAGVLVLFGPPPGLPARSTMMPLAAPTSSSAGCGAGSAAWRRAGRPRRPPACCGATPSPATASGWSSDRRDGPLPDLRRQAEAGTSPVLRQREWLPAPPPARLLQEQRGLEELTPPAEALLALLTPAPSRGSTAVDLAPSSAAGRPARSGRGEDATALAALTPPRCAPAGRSTRGRLLANGEDERASPLRPRCPRAGSRRHRAQTAVGT